MKKAFLILIAITLIFSACKKGVDDFPNTPINVGGATDAPFHPFRAGAKWVYIGRSGVGALAVEDTRVMITTGKTKEIDGDLFYEITTTRPTISATGYLGYNNGLYAQRADNALYNADTMQPIYNDNYEVGELYIQPFSYLSQGQIVNARFNVELLEIGVTKTVRNKEYTDVAHTRVKIEIKLGNDWVSYSGNEFYLARGTGIILASAYAFDVEIDRMELASYTPGL
ncbi:hypothetical protein IM792_20615 [Mucilaginibacter sp. JRF]|uniref:hypothetical protein n=1 Tax=Mucilaginibacter sp. JRF TaxID=2780088 RepID=UPI00187EE7C7|nr:hypothetical protein [Mucilaginibacter sp. JRF]MBE9586864.1 hypothetical protein [Mucilaginibacter sp. JRF]